MKTLVQIFTAFLFLSSAFAQQTLHIHPDHDAALGYHDGLNTANQNYGNATQNSAFCIPGASTGLNMNRALIHFDLSQIAPGTAVASATLDLYALGPNGTLPGHTGTANSTLVRAVTSAWQEFTVTWNTQPTYTSQDQVTLAVSSTATQDYLGIDVRNLVQAMVDNPSTNFGFGLMLQNEVVTNALCFASNDNPDSLLRPVLHVTLCDEQYDLIADHDAALGTHDGLGTSTSNYGTAQQNAAYSITANNGTPSGNNNRALIHYDLSGIPSNATVTSATMKLYARGQSGILSGHTGTANATNVLRVTSPWSDATVTWDNAPTTGAVVTVLPQSTSPLQDYTNIDVTAAVQDMVSNPSSNHGFMLQLVNEVEYNALLFQSIDCGVPAQFPALEVHVACGKATAVEEALPQEVKLYPNPTAGELQLSLDLGEPASVTVNLIDLQGRNGRTHDAGIQGTGNVTLDLHDMVAGLPSGLYIVRAQIGDKVLERKVVLTGN